MNFSWSYALKTSSGRFQDVFKMSWENVFKTSRRLQVVLKRSLRRLQDIFKTSCQGVFKMSLKPLQ